MLNNMEHIKKIKIRKNKLLYLNILDFEPRWLSV